VEETVETIEWGIHPDHVPLLLDDLLFEQNVEADRQEDEDEHSQLPKRKGQFPKRKGQFSGRMGQEVVERL
jgi:hypothetical protein